MPKCAVKNCKNYTLKTQKKDGVSYFHFPRNVIQKENWRCIIARDRAEEYYEPNASSVVCSNHFSENDMYTTEKGFRRIKKTAVPTLLLAESRTNEEETKSQETPCTSQSVPNFIIDVTTIVPHSQESTSFELGELDKSKIVIEKSPCTSPSIGSAIDTPREATLRKDLRECKRRLLIKNNRIKYLQKANKSLKKQNAALKSLITVLKKSNGLNKPVSDKLKSH